MKFADHVTLAILTVAYVVLVAGTIAGAPVNAGSALVDRDWFPHAHALDCRTAMGAVGSSDSGGWHYVYSL
ncbi:MAG: hypothetical protein KDN22_01385 [Verrucomicrobiae bacterium]|nr:hypothetical protein [Verrucomicrobiae bacterium]